MYCISTWEETSFSSHFVMTIFFQIPRLLMRVKWSQFVLIDHLHLQMLNCETPAAPAFTAKVPEEAEKAIYLHWYITKTEEGTLDLFQQRNAGRTSYSRQMNSTKQRWLEKSWHVCTCTLLSVQASKESLQGESEEEIFVIYHSHLSCTDK